MMYMQYQLAAMIDAFVYGKQILEQRIQAKKRIPLKKLKKKMIKNLKEKQKKLMNAFMMNQSSYKGKLENLEQKNLVKINQEKKWEIFEGEDIFAEEESK